MMEKRYPMRLLRLLVMALLFSPGCRRAPEPGLWVWVPHRGAEEERIKTLAQELGLQARFVTGRDLLAAAPRTVRAVKALVVFEGSGPEMLGSTAVNEILDTGGALLLVGDAASFLEPRLGFRVHTVAPGPLLWQAPARQRLQPGSFSAADGTAQVYGYATRIIGGWGYASLTGDLWAKNSNEVPRWLERPLANGHLVFAGLPLAQLSVQGESQGARLLLERAAELGRLPRLWPTPGGKGGMAINIHLDSRIHLSYLNDILARWPSEVRPTWHVTAGPDCDQEGDGKGVAAGDPGRGRPFVAKLRAVGEVGSHGGWIHNLWGNQAGTWPLDRLEHYLDLNEQALAEFGPLTSFSAPVGLHPEIINPWLIRHGVRAFYLIGESGSPPTRPWIGGHAWGYPMWAFPVSTDGAYASVYEFRAAGLSVADADRWLRDLLDFCGRTHSLRLMYGHPVEWQDYRAAYFGLVDSLAKQVQEDHMTALTLTEYADFLDRHEKVRWSFAPTGNGARLNAEAPSLRDMAFRLPGAWKTGEAGVRVWREDDWTWVRVEGERTSLDVRLLP
jgi:hypothetical protein